MCPGETWNTVKSRRRAISRVPVQVAYFNVRWILMGAMICKRCLFGQNDKVISCAAAADTSIFVVEAKSQAADAHAAASVHTCGFGQVTHAM